MTLAIVVNKTNQVFVNHLHQIQKINKKFIDYYCITKGIRRKK
jgi:hypothetical protein